MVFRISKIHTNADFTFSNNILVTLMKFIVEISCNCDIIFTYYIVIFRIKHIKVRWIIYDLYRLYS